jgi:hypothetical protein
VVKKKKPTRRTPAPSKAATARVLDYKVVELSNVDEATIERSVNDWVRKGWAFDGVQFAMRESSKRPSMAFVFFTRPGVEISAQHDDHRFRSEADADRHLRRLVIGPEAAEAGIVAPVDAWTRLAHLAGEDE